jgi:hypothetical protein
MEADPNDPSHDLMSLIMTPPTDMPAADKAAEPSSPAIKP